MDKNTSEQSDETPQGGWRQTEAPAAPTATTAVERLSNGQFPKGVSGNKHGRPKKLPRAFSDRQFMREQIEELEREVEVNGEKLPARQLMFRGALNAAIKSDPNARKFVLQAQENALEALRLRNRTENSELELAEYWMSRAEKVDRELADEFAELIKRAKKL